jgi:hypothetical protein
MSTLCLGYFVKQLYYGVTKHLEGGLWILIVLGHCCGNCLAGRCQALGFQAGRLGY